MKKRGGFAPNSTHSSLVKHATTLKGGRRRSRKTRRATRRSRRR